MNIYVTLRKIMQGAILVVTVAVIIFVVFRLMPGSPADHFLFSLRTKPTAEEKARILASLGLTHGKWSYENFLVFMKQAFTFNFGEDYYTGQSVYQIITHALPYTLVLVGTGAVLGWILGIPSGITTARLRNKKSESIILTSGLIVSSIPYLIFAVVLFLYFAVVTSIFPIKASFSWNDNILIIMYHLALPLFSIFLIGAAGHLITMRAVMVSILGEDFITTARAKGVPEKQILRRHAARNAMIPVSTRMALELALIVSGAILVNIVFSYPGIGYWLYQAVLTEDYPLEEGATFMISIITILAYLMIDYIHAWLDPRIRV